MATSLMMAGIIRSQPKDLKKKSVRFALPENFLCLKDYNGENGNRNDDRNFWLSPISGAYYDWLQRNSGKSFSSHHPDPNIDVINKGDLYNEDYLQLPGSPTESMQEIGSLASDATFTVSSTQKCSQCYKFEETITTLSKEKEELTIKLKKGEEEIKHLRNNVRKLEESQKEVENNNKATMQRVKFLENNLSQGQAEQAQLQVKLAESRAKLSMLLSGKECPPHKRSKSLEQKELEVEETKAQMDLLRSEVERLTVSSSRVDVLSSTIQVYKDRIAQMQKYVETNLNKERVDIAVQVGCKRMIDRFTKDKTRIPFLVRSEPKEMVKNVEETSSTKENQLLTKENKILLEKDNLIFTLKQTINELEWEKDKLQQKLNQLHVQEKKSNDKLCEKEDEITTLQQKNAVLLESYQKEVILRKKFYNLVEDMKGRVRVYCRIRPLNEGEKQKNSKIIVKIPDKYTLLLQTNKGCKEFHFDGILSSQSNQEDVFKDTEDLIQSVIDGYNVCLFAYGQTGSGKTYTLIGNKDDPGLAIRSFYKVFDLINENKEKQEFTVSISIFELYNDALIDLLKNGNTEEKLEIKKLSSGQVYVQGAVAVKVTNANQLVSLFYNACNNRHTASTKMNPASSRSHLIVNVNIEGNNKLTGTVFKGKFSMIDLAGSERTGKSAAIANQLKEANCINKSLSALADVIAALVTDQSYIPYRNNKLTQLMQDSIGGNSKTLMFVNVSPSECNLDETLSSLLYASRVKQVSNEFLRIQFKPKKSNKI